ncbi:MAG: hypothetical protein K9G12_05245 [Candidatus Nanopelagicales bacterium]|nr:hypothetical protein [Candidatus Nanopelagicales bacterium]
MTSIRLGAALSWARGAYRTNFLAFLTLSLVVTIIQFGQQVAAGPLSDSLTLCLNQGVPSDASAELNLNAVSTCFSAEGSTITMALLAALIFVVVSFLATAGVIRGALYVTRGQKIGFADTFLGPHFGAFAVTIFVIMIAFVAGLFLFIIPALIVILLFQFAPFFVLDRGYAPFTALRASAHLVRTHWSVGILVLVVSAAAYLLSGLFWGIPTVVALPIAALVSAYAYRLLQGESVEIAS